MLGQVHRLNNNIIVKSMVRYQACKLKSGPDLGRVISMQSGTTPTYLNFCLREYADWRRSSELFHHKKSSAHK